MPKQAFGLFWCKRRRKKERKKNEKGCIDQPQTGKNVSEKRCINRLSSQECEENELRRKWGISSSVLICILEWSSGKASEAHKLELLWSLRLFFLPQNDFEIIYIFIIFIDR